MVSVVRCWKAEYQKCKHSILLYMHSMIPIICAAIFAGYYHISRWELATKISAYLEVLAVAFPFLIGIIVGLVVQIENQAGSLSAFCWEQSHLAWQRILVNLVF